MQHFPSTHAIVLGAIGLLSLAPLSPSLAQPAPSLTPRTGTIQSMTIGDGLCYLTLLDDNGRQLQLRATAQLCLQPQKFLNRKVEIAYSQVPVEQCYGIEPCNQTQKQSLITQLNVLDAFNLPAIEPVQTPKPPVWTLLISNLSSWSGKNNTGNFTYNGCNAQGDCIQITGGRASCRQRECSLSWQSEDYQYTITSPIERLQRSEKQQFTTTLTIQKGSVEVLRTSGVAVMEP